ncbi:hypothetical protein HDU98_004224, partial [Podochytrium sp. JEL0797]
MGWLTRLFLLGRKQTLELGDLWQLDSRFDAETLSLDLHQAWMETLNIHSQRDLDEPYEPGTLLRTLIWNRLFARMLFIGVINMISLAAQVISPLFVSWILTIVVEKAAGTQVSAERAAGLILGLLLTQLVVAIAGAHYFRMAASEGIKIRTALSSLIYRKSLKLSSAARQEFNAGKIMTMVSTDASRVEQFCQFANFAWNSPLMIIGVIGFLCYFIGWSALVGIGILLATVPILRTVYKHLSQIRAKVAPITDKRVKMTNEVFSGIRLLKFFSWEPPFLAQIDQIRHLEVSKVLQKSLYNAFAMTVAFSIPILACGFAFVTYGAVHQGDLDATVVFAALSWFQMLRFPIMFFPNVLSSYAEFKVALVRIEALLMAPELDEQPAVNADAEFAVSVSGGEFVWEAPLAVPNVSNVGGGKSDESVEVEMQPTRCSDPVETKSHLCNINLNVAKGSLVAVVGAVGSGKSSLLNAIIGEMKKVHGSVVFNSTMGYAPQTAWIQNATVKENILFGHAFNRERYLRAIRDCALEADLNVLLDGDQTSIGERGINLSGGQKQRVNLARLVYFDADIVLMDDPLSAVDAHVGNFLFENCILGALKNKTRILVTHQLHFLSRVDHIVVMRDGEISEQGTYRNLMEAGGDFATLIEAYGTMEEEEEDGMESQMGEVDVGTASDERDVGLEVGIHSKTGCHEIMQDEERRIGAVGLNVWLQYVNACGGRWFVVGAFFVILALQGVQITNNLWLSWWTDGTFDSHLGLEG